MKLFGGLKTPLAVAAVAALLALGGLAAAVVHPGAAPAAALTDTSPPPQPPPAPTPTTTVPVPTPDPAPAPPPPRVQKPPPKPVPQPRQTASPRYTPPPAPAPTPAPAVHEKPAVVQTAPTAPRIQHRPVVHRRAVVRHIKPKPHPLPAVRHVLRPNAVVGPAPPRATETVEYANAAVIPVGSAQTGGTNGLRPLIVLALCLSFMLFGTAATPAHLVPWRRAATFVRERQVDLTLVGGFLFVAATFAVFLTKG